MLSIKSTLKEGSILTDTGSAKKEVNKIVNNLGLKNSLTDFALIINPDVVLENDTIDEMINASKEIGVHKFIESLPQGYDYNVKERGVTLSSGQRQLIAFLRAYISNPEILVLDEATSSIDSYSEEIIQEATEKITKGKTSIIIAHRLATIRNADRIIMMEKGRIVEEGTHEELINLNEGHYSKLYKLQFEEELIN